MSPYLTHDSILVAIESIFTALLISWFQKSPSGDIGIIDFILGQHEPGLRLKSISFGILAPIVLGIVIGIMKPSSIFVGGIGALLGSFFAVSTAFFHPNLLAPPLQKKLWKARLVYFLFIVSYGMLGTIGSYMILELPNQIQNDSLQVNLLSSLVWGLIIPFVSTGAILLLNNKFKHTFKEQDTQDSYENSKKLDINENMIEVISIEVHNAVRDATAAALEEVRYRNAQFESSIRSEFGKQLDEITKMVSLVYDQEKVREERNQSNIKNTYFTGNYFKGTNKTPTPPPSKSQKRKYFRYGGYYRDGRYIRHKYPAYFS